MKVSPTWQIIVSLPDKFMNYFDQNDAQLDKPITTKQVSISNSDS